jgi:hypothetical protein
MDAAAILDGLSHYTRLPVSTIEAARAERGMLVPEFLGLITDHVENGFKSDAARARLFLVFHMLGEWRETSAYRPLARLLRCADIDKILNDGLTATALQVMAGVFDGDPQPLYDVVLDEKADAFARAAMLEALVTLVNDGRLPRVEAARFLANCFTEIRPVHGCYAWSGWQEAIALLGLEELRPLVKQAFDRGSVERIWLDYEDFEEDLTYAVAHPGQPHPRSEGRYRLFGDTIEELSGWYGFSEEYVAEQSRFARDRARRNQVVYAVEDPTTPFINPSRNVGRNDPCPCGSGKKYKKCCLN